jgi:hypothetical protein
LKFLEAYAPIATCFFLVKEIFKGNKKKFKIKLARVKIEGIISV